MNSTLNKMLALNSPYSIGKEEKIFMLRNELDSLSKFHINNCSDYKRIISSKVDIDYVLPVRLFKLSELRSIKNDDIFKVLTSSGTTSQVVSKIFLDKNTAQNQTKALVHIMQSFLGKQRLPMLIIDHPSVVKDRKNFSARGAGIIGLSNFGRNHTYALRDDMTLDYNSVDEFSERFKGKKKLIFGFTFMIWEYFAQASANNIDLSDSIMIHSGGWKKLEDRAVNNNVFKKTMSELFNIGVIHNFYGMVEQVGSIFMECEEGFFHAPNFADVHIVDTFSHQNLPFGNEGLIRVDSILPRSYPGHKLLTEDIGKIIGEDNCKCGRKGKFFIVKGRLPKAEIRGCSDTHESI